MTPTHIRLLYRGLAVKDIPISGRDMFFRVEGTRTEVYESKRFPRAKLSPFRIFGSTYKRCEIVGSFHCFSVDGAEYI